MTGWFPAFAKTFNQGTGPKIAHLGEGNLQLGSFALEIIEGLRQGRFPFWQRIPLSEL